MAAVGLLTWVMISKYQDHLPLYRLEQIAAREHVILSRSTLAEWVGRVGVALQPLVDRLIGICCKAIPCMPMKRNRQLKRTYSSR